MAQARTAKGGVGKSRSSSPKSSSNRSRSRSGTSSNRSRSAASSRSNAGAAAGSTRARSGSDTRTGGSSNGVMHGVAGTFGSAAKRATPPVMAAGAAAAGVLGGIVLGARVLQPRKKVLGIPIARRGLGLQPMSKEVRKAGKEVVRLVDEVAAVRKQAEKAGKALF